MPMKRKAILKFFVFAVLLGLSQSGCLVFTLESAPKGRDSFMVQSLAFECNSSKQLYYGYHSSASATITAHTERCIDGIPFEGDEVKLAVGLIPGFAKETVREKPENNFISYSFASVFATPFALGIPIISALIFEPFMSAEPEEKFTMAEMSPVGFCKFKKRKRKTHILDKFQFEYLGRQYNNSQFSQVFANVQKDQKIKIKLLSEPVVFASGERLEGMNDFVGMELETTVK